MSIYRGAGGAGDAVADSSSEALLVRELAIEVQADADAAAASATTASTQATNAATSATSASNSASAASTSATNAATSASNASSSASAASTSATNAANSATAAQTAETNAETAETNASNSASAASTSATNAASSATAAASSATSASNSATTASTQATNAATSASNALASQTAAASSATAAASSATSASASAAAASAVALGNEPVRHSVRPSLLLDFANTKLLDPRITFSRASTGTYYDGKTVAKAEENLVLRSQEFDNASWTKLNSTVTANATTSPDGTTTAESVVGDGTTNFHIISQGSLGFLSTNSYVLSVFAKANGLNFIQLLTNPSADGRANFNITAGAGAVGTISGAFSGATITDAGNGWYRCSVVISGSVANTVQIGLISSATSARAESFATSNGAYLWGAQVEQRSSVTAYTPTTTAPITNYIPALQTAASGVARFEHNPVTGESLGLEIEEQRTNLVTYSSQFDDAAWTKTRSSITANTIVAPDGTLTGDKLVEDTTASNTHVTTRTVTVSAQSYTSTVYAKAGERSWIAIQNFTGSVNVTAYFDLANGVVGTVTNGTSAISSVGDGWYRCSVTFTVTTGTSTAFAVYLATGNSSPTYTGDGYSGIYIWGAQLEAGSFPTSYIPTVASQVTRSADAAVMTGTNFSSWYRADEGTIYSETNTPPVSSSFVYSFDKNTGGYGPRMQLAWSSLTQQNLAVVDDASAVVVSLIGTGTKAAVVYKLNDFASSFNSGAVGADTAGAPPNGILALRLGAAPVGNAQLNSTIKKIAYYPKRLTNAELQGLTTV